MQGAFIMFSGGEAVKLTLKQKKNIVAALLAKEATQKELAIKYKVSEKTIGRVLKAESEMSDMAEKCLEIKKQAEQEALDEVKDDIKDQRKTVEELIQMGLKRAKDLIEVSTLREVMGMVKVLRENFPIDSAEDDELDDTPAVIEVIVEDASGGEE